MPTFDSLQAMHLRARKKNRIGLVAWSLTCLAALAGCAESHVNDAPIPNFSGHWEHVIAHYLPPENGPGPVVNMPGLSFAAMNLWIGDYRNPILLPWASDAVKEHDILELERGEPALGPSQLCMPFGVPYALLLREPVQLLQEPGVVTFLYHHDSQVRRIYLGERHPDTPRRSPYGHSVGHYEGDTLVVDTIAMSTTGPLDYYGTPHTDLLHVVERYRLIEGGRSLRVDFVVEDQNAFTTAWRGAQLYRPSPEQTEFRENICAENIRYAAGEEFPVPQDASPDF